MQHVHVKRKIRPTDTLPSGSLTLSDWVFFLEFQQNSRIATRIASARPHSSTTKTPPGTTKPEAHYFNASGPPLSSSNFERARCANTPLASTTGTCLSSTLVPSFWCPARRRCPSLWRRFVGEQREKGEKKGTTTVEKSLQRCSGRCNGESCAQCLSRACTRRSIARLHLSVRFTGKTWRWVSREDNDRELNVRGDVYTDKRRGVFVFIAIRESCAKTVNSRPGNIRSVREIRLVAGQRITRNTRKLWRRIRNWRSNLLQRLRRVVASKIKSKLLDRIANRARRFSERISCVSHFLSSTQC